MHKQHKNPSTGFTLLHYMNFHKVLKRKDSERLKFVANVCTLFATVRAVSGIIFGDVIVC